MIISFHDVKTKAPLLSLDELLNFERADVGKSYTREFLVVNTNKFEPVVVTPVVKAYDYAKKDYSKDETDVTIVLDKNIKPGGTANATLTFAPSVKRESALNAKIFWQCEVG